MQQLSGAPAAEFDNLAALKELYIYVNKYYGDIVRMKARAPLPENVARPQAEIHRAVSAPSASKRLLNRNVENKLKV